MAPATGVPVAGAPVPVAPVPAAAAHKQEITASSHPGGARWPSLAAVQAMGDLAAEAESYEPNWMARRIGAQSIEKAEQAAAGAAKEMEPIEALQQKAIEAQEKASIARLEADNKAEREREAVELAVSAAQTEAALKKARTEAARLEAERIASADRVARMEAEVSQRGVCRRGVRAVSSWHCKRTHVLIQRLAAAPNLTQPSHPRRFICTPVQARLKAEGRSIPAPSSVPVPEPEPLFGMALQRVGMAMQSTSVEAVKAINEAKRWPSVARMKAEADMAREERSYAQQHEVRATRVRQPLSAAPSPKCSTSRTVPLFPPRLTFLPLAMVWITTSV